MYSIDIFKKMYFTELFYTFQAKTRKMYKNSKIIEKKL